MLDSTDNLGPPAAPAPSKPVERAEREAARPNRPVFRSIRPSTVTERRLRSIRAVILMEGSVGASPFADAVGRSLLELPVDARRAVLDVWREQLAVLAASLGLSRMPCRIVVGRSCRSPQLRDADAAAGITVERDPSEFRGTGGLLRDLSVQYQPDDGLLVASAAQLLTQPLDVLASEAAARGGDVTVVANTDGTPSGVTLVSCRALQCLPPIGFIDFKEQGLPLVVKAHRVTVRYGARPSGLSIRTSRDYLRALRAHHGGAAGDPSGASDDPFAERWQSAVALVEPGGRMAPTARLHDAVVLSGGVVDAGATVVRSVVCAGGRVRRNDQAIDRCVTAAG
jgi:hypothetical protein